MTFLFFFLIFLVRKGSWFWLHLWSWSFRMPFHVCHIKSHEYDRSFYWLCDQCSWILSFTYGYIGRHLYPPFITVSQHNITLNFFLENYYTTSIGLSILWHFHWTYKFMLGGTGEHYFQDILGYFWWDCYFSGVVTFGIS